MRENMQSRQESMQVCMQSRQESMQRNYSKICKINSIELGKILGKKSMKELGMKFSPKVDNN